MCMMPVYYTIIIFDIEEVGLRREKKDQAYRNRYHLHGISLGINYSERN